MRSLFARVNAETLGFSLRARGGRTVKPEMPTMRASSPSRYSVSVVSSVRQTMREGWDTAANLIYSARPMILAFWNWLDRYLFGEYSEGATPGARALRILRYPYAILRDLSRGHINLHAMGLVYATLLSLVPLIAFAFAVL